MAACTDFQHIDRLDAEAFSPFGAYPVVIVNAAQFKAADQPLQAVIIGCDAEGTLPAIDTSVFDLLLTVAPAAPSPWVSIPASLFAQQVKLLDAAVRNWPYAASILCQVLRQAERASFADALITESLAYSALLGGDEFGAWRSARGAPRPLPSPMPTHDPVHIARVDDHITLTLNTPDNRNAMTAAMRDALYEALANALDDPSAPSVSLRGAGKCFSTGGHLPEFGSARDLAQAHVVRTTRSCARLIDALGERIEVRFQGACVGSGLEVPMAAARRFATADAFFQLPELNMGLIPGAGGTVTVARAIGRHRTAWMVLSGKRMNASQALGWGLVQAIVA